MGHLKLLSIKGCNETLYPLPIILADALLNPVKNDRGWLDITDDLRCNEENKATSMIACLPFVLFLQLIV